MLSRHYTSEVLRLFLAPHPRPPALQLFLHGGMTDYAETVLFPEVFCSYNDIGHKDVNGEW